VGVLLDDQPQRQGVRLRDRRRRACAEAAARGTHEYAKFLRPSELAAWCRAASLEPVSTRGLEYNPLSRRYRLSADTSVNYLVACRKPA
jgi:2-polyprenyl-3-methyl-5-hydroxy-6-metoxy-1,4-benzoquinol methylase